MRDDMRNRKLGRGDSLHQVLILSQAGRCLTEQSAVELLREQRASSSACEYWFAFVIINRYS